MSYCYLIHFSQPIGNPHNPRGKAQHYLGYTSRRGERRLYDHLEGRGARITCAASLAGVELTIVKTWRPGTRTLERQLKNRKSHKHFCPVCTRRKA